jgi:uncharacterized OsmC-like protein
MYQVSVDDGPSINVQARSRSIAFAIDGSAMNPLEGFYATLAGCAAVYVKKACQALGVSAAGIQVHCRPRAGKAGAPSLERFETELAFPEGFPGEHKAAVMDAVTHCAVKEVVQNGAAVEFVCREA